MPKQVMLVDFDDCLYYTTEGVNLGSYREAFAHFGHPLNDVGWMLLQQYFDQRIYSQELIRRVVADLGLGLDKDIIGQMYRYKKDLYLRKGPEMAIANPTPLVDVVRMLGQEHPEILQGIVTDNYTVPFWATALYNDGLLPYPFVFSVHASEGDDPIPSKPDPATLLIAKTMAEAIRGEDIPLEQFVYVGDSEKDRNAAGDAGMPYADYRDFVKKYGEMLGL